MKEGVNVVGLAKRVERVQVGSFWERQKRAQLNPYENNLRPGERRSFRVIPLLQRYNL